MRLIYTFEKIEMFFCEKIEFLLPLVFWIMESCSAVHFLFFPWLDGKSAPSATPVRCDAALAIDVVGCTKERVNDSQCNVIFSLLTFSCKAALSLSYFVLRLINTPPIALSIWTNVKCWWARDEVPTIRSWMACNTYPSTPGHWLPGKHLDTTMHPFFSFTLNSIPGFQNKKKIDETQLRKMQVGK